MVKCKIMNKERSKVQFDVGHIDFIDGIIGIIRRCFNYIKFYIRVIAAQHSLLRKSMDA